MDKYLYKNALNVEQITRARKMDKYRANGISCFCCYEQVALLFNPHVIFIVQHSCPSTGDVDTILGNFLPTAQQLLIYEKSRLIGVTEGNDIQRK